jgi:hypothetical protein
MMKMIDKKQLQQDLTIYWPVVVGVRLAHAWVSTRLANQTEVPKLVLAA